MRDSFRRTIQALVICAILTPSAIIAQRATFVEFNVGLSAGDASVPTGPSRGISGDLLLGLPRGRSMVIALSVSGQKSMANVVCDVVPGGSCQIDFPTFKLLAAQIGWETNSGRVRVLAGPALAIAGPQAGVAAQVRVELSKPVSEDLALIASARLAYIPDIADKSFSLGAIGIGLRVQ